MKRTTKSTRMSERGPRQAPSPQLKELRLADLHPAQYNPRTISDEALAGLTKSIERFGCVELIVVNVHGGSNQIVGGHQRLKALQALGHDRAICVTVDCSPDDEQLLNISLNNPNLAGHFSEQLSLQIDDLRRQCSPDLLSSLRIGDLSPDPSKGHTPEVCWETLGPYKRTHILLSFPPEVIVEISESLERIIKNPKVEYEQSSN